MGFRGFIFAYWPFPGWRAGGLVGVMWAASKIQGLVRASHLLSLILLVSFSDTLLVVSILDIV